MSAATPTIDGASRGTYQRAVICRHGRACITPIHPSILAHTLKRLMQEEWLLRILPRLVSTNKIDMFLICKVIRGKGNYFFRHNRLLVGHRRTRWRGCITSCFNFPLPTSSPPSSQCSPRSSGRSSVSRSSLPANTGRASIRTFYLVYRNEKRGTRTIHLWLFQVLRRKLRLQRSEIRTDDRALSKVKIIN